jgi:hypothetical protein
MAINTDLLIDYNNKRIYENAAFDPTTDTAYSGNALYSYLQDTFDELAQMDDDVPMSAQTPNAYSMINGWHLTNGAIEWLDDASIETVGYTDELHYFTFQSSGYTSAVPTDIGKTVNDDGVDFGTLIEYNNAKRFWIVRTGSSNYHGLRIRGNYRLRNRWWNHKHRIQDGSACSRMCLPWVLFTTNGTTYPQMYIVQDGVKLQNNAGTQDYWWGIGHIDVLVTTKVFGVEIDDGNVTIFDRNYPTAGGSIISLFDHFEIDLSAGGRNAVPIATQQDLNNTKSRAAAQALADTDIGGDLATGINVTVVPAGFSEDLGNGNGSKTYNIRVDCNNQPIQDVYEVLKWAVAEFNTNTFAVKSGGTVAGFAYKTFGDDLGWPELKAAPFGSFAGGTFFGARGVWLDNVKASDIQSFQLIASDGTTQSPPNTVGIAVTSLVAGDRVLVAETDGPGSTTINYSKYTGAASGNNSSDPTFVVTGTIESDEPATGWFNVDNGDGTFDRYKYSSRTGSTFTLDATEHPGGLSRNYNASEGVWVGIILDEATSDELSNTLIYASNINVVIRVRKKGILPFQIAGVVGTNGLSQAAIRTTDTIVT